MSADHDLLDEFIREHSQEAFAALVRRYSALVYSTALRRMNGDAARAQDVVQVVFTTLAADAARLRRHPSLAGWLYTVTRHAAARHLRADQRRLVRETKACAMNSDSAAPAPTIDWQHVRPILDPALDELSSTDREALLRRFFGCESLASIAASLRVSEDAARKRVDRALERLKAALARRGITSTVAALEAALVAEAQVVLPTEFATTVATAAIAGLTVSPAPLLFSIMNTKIVSLGATVLAFVAAGIAWQESRLVRTKTMAVADITQERDSLRAQLERTGAQLRQANVELDAARKEATAKPAATVRPDRPGTGASDRLEYVLDHPETHAAYQRRSVLGTWAKYGRFMDKAALSVGQREQFRQALERIIAADFDILVALHAQGLSTFTGNQPPPELRKLILENRARMAADLRGSLGDAGLKEFAAYTALLPEHNVVDRLAGRLYSSDAPLTAEQGDQLAALLKQCAFTPSGTNTSRRSLGGVPLPPTAVTAARAELAKANAMNDWESPVTDAAIAAARQVLSPSQLTALEHVQAEQLATLQTVATASPTPASPAGGG